ncbi:hypothetical protein BUALT_Bualt16G0028400 [Buddleja alternifolia]|uniref:TCP transcription factor n=1 Tax=Buddleja alternifolia TaxID=168488 RepID=A0AAV6WJ68_9LAMI|nr:hypothetical protein BUALT_Bualt16G0028400 [Buddleja alternifolia]
MFTVPQICSSSHDLDTAEIFLHKNHDLVSSNYLAANVPFLEYNQEIVEAINIQPYAIKRKVPSKSQTERKDRHSKIFTAQGPRDRRVRLSIPIARKFFDLQEMLGFEKPSKTLDWLLTKSKAAIEDLVQKKSSNSISFSPSERVVVSAGNIEAFENGNSLRAEFRKAMREKARARARERTREKMCIKQMIMSEAIRKNGYDLMNSSIPIQYHEPMVNFPINYEAAANEDLIQESILIRRKFKHYPPSIFGFQQNVIFSRDSSSNFTQNWDHISSFTSQTDVLDQHKFINREFLIIFLASASIPFWTPSTIGRFSVKSAYLADQKGCFLSVNGQKPFSFFGLVLGIPHILGYCYGFDLKCSFKSGELLPSNWLKVNSDASFKDGFLSATFLVRDSFGAVVLTAAFTDWAHDVVATEGFAKAFSFLDKEGFHQVIFESGSLVAMNLICLPNGHFIGLGVEIFPYNSIPFDIVCEESSIPPFITLDDFVYE